MALDMGNVPDWVQAVGTSGALIYIAAQYQFDRRKTREAKADAERVRRDNEAAQARQIVISHSGHYDETVGSYMTVRVVNDSDRLIRHLALVIDDDETGADGIDISTPVDDPDGFWYTADQITAGGHATMRVLTRYQPVTTLEQSLEHGFASQEEQAAFLLELRYIVSVVFTDAAGLIWRQTRHGYPERLTSWTPPATPWRPPVVRAPERTGKPGRTL